MAITMSKQSSIPVLISILGEASQAMSKVKYLQSIGSELTVGLFTLTIVVKGQTFTSTMPAALSLFSTQDAKVQCMIKQKVELVVEDALKASAGPADTVVASPFNTVEPVISPPSTTPAWMKSVPPTAKEVHAAQTVAASMPKPAPAPVPPVTPSFEDFQKEEAIKATAIAAAAVQVKSNTKPTNTVMKLKEARALSQQVRGTSGGSIYRAAAIGKVNIAIREQTGTVSIRAEFQDSKDDGIASKLVSLGFTENASYLSMHISLTDGAPAMRVVGSILLGAGIEFEQIATTKEQISGN